MNPHEPAPAATHPAPGRDGGGGIEDLPGANPIEIVALDGVSIEQLGERIVALVHASQAGGAEVLVAASWPCLPGSACFGADGLPWVMHHAPRRWFLPQASAALRAALQGLGPGFAVFELGGQWRGLRLRGATAREILCASLPVDAVLAGRDCAAVHLFDVPARLARTADGYAVWIPPSYLRHFLEAAKAAGRPA